MVKENIMSDKHSITIGAILGIFKGIFDSEHIADYTQKIILTFVLGIVGAVGGIIGKKIWKFFENKFK